MREYPAVAAPSAITSDPPLDLHHYGAFGLAFVVMLAHLGALGWSDVEVGHRSLGFLSDGLQTGLHVAIAVMLTALSAALPNRGLRYLGVAFTLLAVGESGVALSPLTEFAQASSIWFHAVGTLGYVALVLLYARRLDREGARSAEPPLDGRTADWTVSTTAVVLVIGLSLIAVLPFVSSGSLMSSDSGLRVALSTFIGAAPIVALAAIVNRRGECVISIWLIALLAVQALAWSGRYSPGTWGMQLALFSSLIAELALLNAIMMSIVQHVRSQMHANRHLHTLAHTDCLTGLYNRRYLDIEIERACLRARRHGTWLAVVMADIDHFKLFNDSYGHLRGDECLRRVASVFLQRQQRCDDVACRYGGEEFAMILPACDLEAARGLATLLRDDVRKLDIPHERSICGRVTMSFGIVSMQITGDERGSDLLRLADEALYAAKRAGRDMVCEVTGSSGPQTGPAAGNTWRIQQGGARRAPDPILRALGLPCRALLPGSWLDWGAVFLFCGLALVMHWANATAPASCFVGVADAQVQSGPLAEDLFDSLLAQVAHGRAMPAARAGSGAATVDPAPISPAPANGVTPAPVLGAPTSPGPTHVGCALLPPRNQASAG